ncbi:A/G-specific adenine glycosylase [Paenibacillus thalictri]|uniref:Adenine DNA glycosylase n=1 Tax=Paenibacillus thalictri TaxID=2527873 RepID=A0A4Q9DIN3_9BACL|nr:A/G-specific adenine glycosylase [Paenibacillus thalictri]TBL71176.1 A/G-specific adenine glycosylase [Paenibacillus thalictri]
MNIDERKTYFSTELLAWYRRHHRDLPWRRSRNPYYIWVSEIMLQQTRVDTVIPYFERFIGRFPTVEALALAPEEDVLKLWEGLGYYSRARNLQAAVKEVHERYDGVVPSEKTDISSLKGVGPYTSGAILSIAYNKPEPAVDGNVMRVLSRYFIIEEDIMKISTRTLMEKLAKELIPEGAAGDFNQALMELGATVCTPRSPYCLTCPVREGCAGREEGREETLPVKKKAKPPRPEKRLVALIEGTGELAGRILIRQRPQEGLLARMWELPHVEVDKLPPVHTGEDVHNMEGSAILGERIVLAPNAALERLEAHLAEEGIAIEPQERLMDAEHTFSHIHWEMQVYRCRIKSGWSGKEQLPQLTPYHYRWLAPDELPQYAFPNVFLRIMKQYRDTR